MAPDRSRLSVRCVGIRWRTKGEELNQRSLYPQHVRGMARADDTRPWRIRERRSMTPNTQAISKDHAPLTVHECEQFLVHEAALLDEARFDDWLDLFTEDARYWVPSEPNQASPYDTVSLIYDDRRLLETRVRRLASPQIYSQEPRSRTSRIAT